MPKQAGSRPICSPGPDGSYPDGNLYSFLDSTSGPQNYGKYVNPVMDKLLDDARAETDTAKRTALYGQIAVLTQKDLPISYIYTTRYFNGLSAKVSGFKPVADGIIRLQGIRPRDMNRLRGRLLQLIPTLLLVSLLVFGLQQLMPGDPALVLAGEEGGNPQVLAQIRAELWLDRPLPVQYVHWLGNLLHGDLGYSWRIRQPVASLVREKLPVTLQLGLMAFAFAVLIGVTGGCGLRCQAGHVVGSCRQPGWARRGCPRRISGWGSC